jgi:hypothetical protein
MNLYLYDEERKLLTVSNLRSLSSNKMKNKKLSFSQLMIYRLLIKFNHVAFRL